MHLEWLELGDFRSYESLRFEPQSGINVLIGQNGAGKTNVLEAIGYLSQLKSFRRTPDAALVRAGAERAIARGGFRNGGSTVDIAVEIPTSGRRQVLVNGINVGKLKFNKLWQLRRHIGVVFQDYKLLPGKTILENVAFALEIVGANKKTIRYKAWEALKNVGLSHRKDAYPLELSGGQQNRLRGRPCRADLRPYR